MTWADTRVAGSPHARRCSPRRLVPFRPTTEPMKPNPVSIQRDSTWPLSRIEHCCVTPLSPGRAVGLGLAAYRARFKEVRSAASRLRSARCTLSPTPGCALPPNPALGTAQVNALVSSRPCGSRWTRWSVWFGPLPQHFHVCEAGPEKSGSGHADLHPLPTKRLLQLKKQWDRIPRPVAEVGFFEHNSQRRAIETSETSQCGRTGKAFLSEEHAQPSSTLLEDHSRRCESSTEARSSLAAQ